MTMAAIELGLTPSAHPLDVGEVKVMPISISLWASFFSLKEAELVLLQK